MLEVFLKILHGSLFRKTVKNLERVGTNSLSTCIQEHFGSWPCLKIQMIIKITPGKRSELSRELIFLIGKYTFILCLMHLYMHSHVYGIFVNFSLIK